MSPSIYTTNLSVIPESVWLKQNLIENLFNFAAPTKLYHLMPPYATLWKPYATWVHLHNFLTASNRFLSFLNDSSLASDLGLWNVHEKGIQMHSSRTYSLHSTRSEVNNHSPRQDAKGLWNAPCLCQYKQHKNITPGPRKWKDSKLKGFKTVGWDFVLEKPQNCWLFWFETVGCRLYCREIGCVIFCLNFSAVLILLSWFLFPKCLKTVGFETVGSRDRQSN